MFFDLTVFVTELMSVNLFFQLFTWKPCTWAVKMTGKLKVCPNKWPSAPNIVRWLAVILSPVLVNKTLNNKQNV